MRRFGRALLAVAGILASISIAMIQIGELEGPSSTAIAREGEGASTMDIFAGLREGKDPVEAITASSSLEILDPAVVPDRLREEVLEALFASDGVGEGTTDGGRGTDLRPIPVDERMGILATEDCSLICFAVPIGAEEAEDAIVKALGASGWMTVESDSEGVVSLAKTEGEFRWMVLQFVGGERVTSVVLHIALI